MRDSVEYCSLQGCSDGSIVLEKGKDGEIPASTDVGTGSAPDIKSELSQLIDILNDRFGPEFKPGDQLFFNSVREDAVSDKCLREAAKANTIENFRYSFSKQLESLFVNRMDQNEEITAKFMNEIEYRMQSGKIC